MKNNYTLLIKEYILSEVFEDADRRHRAISKINALQLNIIQKAALSKEVKKLKAELDGKSDAEVEAICEQWEKEIDGKSAGSKVVPESQATLSVRKERVPSEACVAYARSVHNREHEQPMPAEAWCFTNQFGEAIQFKRELWKLVPDLDDVLSVMEVDALIDFVYDKTCEDLRKKGFLSEESKQLLLR